MTVLGSPPEGDSLTFVCQNGYALGGTPDETRSGCAGQKDASFIGVSAWSTWPRGAPKHGNVSLLFCFRGPFVNISHFRNVAEFSLKSALQHRFHLFPQSIPSSDLVPLRPRGPIDALRELKAAGCHLATQEWVDNHWSLILWKLAGMAALDPESEADVDRRRWSWAETMRQLQYRYASPSIFLLC